MAIALQQQITNVKLSSELDLIAGLWLVISPFVLGFAATRFEFWSTVVSGAVVAVLSASRSLGDGYRYSWPSWVNLLVGAWLIIAPFVLGFAVTAATWNSIILGILVMGLSGWSLASTPETM
jgi:hypothetical protein